ncbi:MAG TPA: hypothetical protein VFC78_22740 [Tepidisphaeraceae bacterium]|nr:hypothetical protein [Tepidisphaeraceae bacterium]
MLKSHSIAGLLLAAALLIQGCGAQPGRSLVTFHRNGEAPPLSNAENDGWYALYPGNGLNPLDSVYLHRDDKFGFETADSRTVGVYVKNHQTNKIPLSGVLTTEYIWKYQGAEK